MSTTPAAARESYRPAPDCRSYAELAAEVLEQRTKTERMRGRLAELVGVLDDCEDLRDEVRNAIDAARPFLHPEAP